MLAGQTCSLKRNARAQLDYYDILEDERKRRVYEWSFTFAEWSREPGGYHYL